MGDSKDFHPGRSSLASQSEDRTVPYETVGKRTLIDNARDAQYASVGKRTLTGSLGAQAGDNFMQVGLCGTLLGALHQIQLTPTPTEVARQRHAIADRFTDTALAGDRLWYLLTNFMKVVNGDDEHALASFTGNLSWAPDAIGRGGYRDVLALAREAWNRHQLVTSLAGRGASPSRSIAPAKRKDRDETARPAAKVPTPELDAAIDALEVAAKLPLPEAVKAPIETMKSSLELARTARRHGEAATYAKQIASLGEGMFKTIGEIVKSAGGKAELATQACEQLTTVARVLGKTAKGIGALDNLSKVLLGKTLAGTPVEQGERYDAAIELVALAAGTTAGAAITISKIEYMWLFNHIGVPIKQATEEAGLAQLFEGEAPEHLKARIEAMPTDAEHAMATIRTLQSGTFKSRKSLTSAMIVDEAWTDFLRHRQALSGQNVQQINQSAKDRPGENPMTDLLRTTLAETYKAAAIAFVDKQVRDARSWDR